MGKPMARIDVSPAQFKFLKTTKPFGAFVGGWWSGKSYVGAMRLAQRMRRDPGHEHCYWGPSMALLKGKPTRCVAECLTRVGIPHRQSRPDGSVLFDCGKYGSIWLRSFHRIEGIRSFDAVEQVVDEIDSLPLERANEVWQQVLGRSRGAGDPFVGAMSTPDAGKAGFLYDFFVKNEENNTVELLHAKTRDNLWQEGVEDYVKRLESQLPGDLAKLYLEGQFVSRGEGRVFSEYKTEAHTDEVEDIDAYERLHIGLDFNIDACCAVVGVKTNDDRLIVIDEFVSRDTEQFCKRARSLYEGRELHVYPDASGDSRTTNATDTDLTILRNNRFFVIADRTNPRIDSSVAACQVALKNAKVAISSKCVKLRMALSEHQYEREKPKKYAVHPSIDDWTDAFRYLVYKLFPLRTSMPGMGMGIMR